MERATILSLAGLCGIGAFLWTMASHPPPRDRPVFLPGAGAARIASPRFPGARAAIPPTDLPGLEQAARDNPGDCRIWFSLAQRRRAADMPEQETLAWRKVVETASAATAAHRDDAHAWFMMGWAGEKLGDHDRAKAAFDIAAPAYERWAATTAADNPIILTRLGWMRRILGDDRGAVAAWTQGKNAIERTPDHELHQDASYNLACFRALLGDKDGARQALLQTVGTGYDDADWTAHDDDLESLHDDSFFKILLFKMSKQPPHGTGGE